MTGRGINAKTQRMKGAAKTILSLTLTLSPRERGQRSAAMVDLRIIGCRCTDHSPDRSGETLP